MQTKSRFLESLRDFLNALRQKVFSKGRWSALLNRLARILEPSRADVPTEQAADHAVVVVETTAEPVRVKESPVELIQQKFGRYLQAHNLSIVAYRSGVEINPVLHQRRKLDFFMVQHCDKVLPLIHTLRPTLQNRRMVKWAMERDPDSICVLTNVGSRMYQQYILDRYSYDRANSCLKVRVRQQPFAHNFISGQWFELGISEKVQRWLDQRGYPNCVYQNLQLRTVKGATLEVDLLITVVVRGEVRFIMLECKSGNGLTDEEVEQIGRANRLLNMNWNRSAVITPEPLAKPFVQQWELRAGVSFVELGRLEEFLCEAVA